MRKFRHLAHAASLAVFSIAAGLTASYAADPTIKPWGFDLSGIDTAVKPGDDFFDYAGGAWMKSATIPDDRSSWGGFASLSEKAERDTRDVLEKNVGDHAPGTIEQQVADFYSTYQDTATLEAKGLEPAKADLDRIAAAATHDDLAGLMGEVGMPGGPVGMGIGIDAKKPDVYILDVSQAGLGLPDRDYYLVDDQGFKDALAAYKVHIGKMLALAGYPDAEKHAEAIVALETQIATDSWPNEKRRNRDLTYNMKTLEELVAFAPEFAWKRQLDALGLSSFDRFNVNETDAIQKLAKVFKDTPLDTWKAYMTFHYLSAYADVLPKAFDDEAFNFTKVITGQKVQKERWKRAVAILNGVQGEAVGQLYVRDHFSPEAKAAMVELIENLRAAYKQRIEALDWMSAETKAQALDKLAKFGVKVGYPDKWKPYDGLEIVKGDALGNAKRLGAFEWNRNRTRIDQPVDKTEWLMPPQQVNAYYMPPFNEIVFPAAILQAPFFDLNADPAINYGGIGGVIGHEMGHGFDDQGAKVDAQGVQRNWWTPADEAAFQEKVKALAAQYDTFEALPGLFVKGMATSGENIGDLGGLSVAHEAYKISLKGAEPEVKDGFTGEQRFFLGWAQVWRSIMRDEALRARVASDEHSPARFRVNGVVPNMDSWYTAFGVGADAKMYLAPEKRVRIW